MNSSRPGNISTLVYLYVPNLMCMSLLLQGYDLGEMADDVDGEVLIEALKAQEGQRTIARGAKGIEEAGSVKLKASGVESVGIEVQPKKLQEMLTYPKGWGPSQWGPIPFLPSNDILVQRIQKQWGDLYRYK